MTWWQPSWRADPRAAAIADRHYNRQKIGAPQFVPPGRCCRTCPVRAECLEAGRTEHFGIWGGRAYRELVVVR